MAKAPVRAEFSILTTYRVIPNLNRYHHAVSDSPSPSPIVDQIIDTQKANKPPTTTVNHYSKSSTPPTKTIILAVSLPLLVIVVLIFGYERCQKRRRRQTHDKWEDAFFPANDDNALNHEQREGSLEDYNARMQTSFGFQMSRDDTYDSGFRGMYQVWCKGKI